MYHTKPFKTCFQSSSERSYSLKLLLNMLGWSSPSLLIQVLQGHINFTSSIVLDVIMPNETFSAVNGLKNWDYF